MKSYFRGVALTKLEVIPDPERDTLMLVANIDVRELKHQRHTVQAMASPRPRELRVGVSDFDPSGGPGQRAVLHLVVPARTYIGKGSGGRAARSAGKPVRQLARLYQREPGNLFGLSGSLENTKLTSLLTHLKSEAGGQLETVDLLIRRTPLPSERDAVWTVFIALAERGVWKRQPQGAKSQLDGRDIRGRNSECP